MPEEQTSPPPSLVAVMVPFPMQGHLNQLLHLSRLLLSYHIPVHYASTPSHNRQAKLRFHGWDSLAAAAVHFHDFPIPPFLTPPPDPNAPLGFPSHLLPAFSASSHLRQPVADLLRRLSSQARKVVVINDSMMGFVARDASLIPNAESYTFHSVSAFCCFLHSWERMGKPEIDLNGGKIPLDVPSFEGCFPSEFWDFISLQRKQLRYNSGYIYNTSRVIEGDCIQFMQSLEKTISDKKHWALGPFNPVKVPQSDYKKKHFSLEWLDEQAENSVVYVSFGTTTAMAEEQIREIAAGLRRSGQKFVWVIRDADKGDVFSGEVRRLALPEGYEYSVKNVGLIVKDWAPQLDILAHPAVGGFVSHCGWNSCMESITMGKPIGAWPMHSDQPRNTVLVTEVLRVGVVVRGWAARQEMATTEVVESGVRRLMEGEEVRRRAAALGRSVRESVEEGGISRLELADFVAHISR